MAGWTTRTRTAVFAALMIACGCGGGDSDSSVPESRLLARAADRTQDQRSAQVRIDLESQPSRTVAFNGSGQTRLDRDFFRARVTYESFPDLRPGTEADLIVDGEQGFIRLARRRRWILIPQGSDFSIGIAEGFEYLRSLTGSVMPTGRSDVGGVSTTGYRGTVDMKRVAGRLAPDRREAFRQKLVRYGNLERLPIEVFLDEKDLVRRIRYEIGLPHGQKLRATLELTDFGRPVNEEPPPPALVQRAP